MLILTSPGPFAVRVINVNKVGNSFSFYFSSFRFPFHKQNSSLPHREEDNKRKEKIKQL